MQPFIYINGFPGVGKLTIARKLQKLLPKAELIDNHQLIDPVAARFERTDPEYQGARKKLRQSILKPIATSTCTSGTAWIFTDSQSSDALGRSTAQEFKEAAAQGSLRFISIVLTCSMEENKKRLISHDRLEGAKTKLIDVNVFEDITAGNHINRFHTETELVLDVTMLDSEKAASTIFQHVTSHTM